LLFDQIAQARAVYLLDEFDAIGSRRGQPNDVGEIRRVLNSVLAFMEEPNSTDSLVIAATNHVEILDNALARRFDEVISIIFRTPARREPSSSVGLESSKSPPRHGAQSRR
jgi:SpoVK/Ycf46/Vps4 family AAA+-type ATPase